VAIVVMTQEVCYMYVENERMKSKMRRKLLG
jgi:hypothetical protein